MDSREAVPFVRLFPPQLCLGSVCSAVSVLQGFLLGRGITGKSLAEGDQPGLTVTGIYDEPTARAVKELQRQLQFEDHELEYDGHRPGEGHFGPRTRSALKRWPKGAFDADAVPYETFSKPGFYVDERGVRSVWPVPVLLNVSHSGLPDQPRPDGLY